MKTRLRTLHVGDMDYRWTAEVGLPRCVRVRVWGGGKNGCVLRVDLMANGDPGLWGDDPDMAWPTPGVVRVIIEYALSHGWDPAAIGGRHVLDTSARLRLPGFRITNVLQGMQDLRS